MKDENGVSPSEGYKICPNCGEKNEASADACECNSLLDEANKLSGFSAVSQTIEGVVESLIKAWYDRSAVEALGKRSDQKR